MNPCGKYWYKTAEEAEAKRRRMADTDHYAEYLNVYFCERCEGFHVGHSFTRQNRPISICSGEMK